MSSIFFNRYYQESDTLAGGLKLKTTEFRGLLRQVIVKPATASTMFDFSISDGSSLNLFERESTTDELNETPQIPIQSALVITVTNATADETFKIYLAIQEKA